MHKTAAYRTTDLVGIIQMQTFRNIVHTMECRESSSKYLKNEPHMPQEGRNV